MFHSKKKQYTLEATFTAESGIPKINLSFDSVADRDKRFQEIVDSHKNGKDIINILAGDKMVDTDNTVLEVSFIAAIISAEFHRQMLIKSMLNDVEVNNKLAGVAIDCFNAFRLFPAENITLTEYREKVIEWTRNELLEKHLIRLK